MHMTIDAVQDILGRAVVEVRKNAFDFDNSDGRTLNWTPIQFWTVMKQLAAFETVGVLSPISLHIFSFFFFFFVFLAS
jgi:hypothetical protein